jgi:endonuclease/exonuclease/phosphatase family metal-dependent hydrolase
VLSGLYAVVVLMALGLVRWVGAEWWGVSVLLFMPRWIFLGPVVLLSAVSAALKHPLSLAIQGTTALVVAGPLMGFSSPVGQLWERPAAGERVRIVTFNLSIDPIRSDDFLYWVEREKVDVVCFQEGSREDDVTKQAFEDAGWHLSNRRSIACRSPIAGEFPPFRDEWDSEERYSSVLERVRVRTPGGSEFVIASVHLPTIRPGLERLLNHRDASGLKLHLAWWGRETARVLTALAESNALPMLVAGDFNMPADDTTMAALRGNFRFAFEEVGWGYGYTRPARCPWVRIDHVLAGPEWTVASCRVGPDFGSDHLPLLADVVLPFPAATSQRPAPTTSEERAAR